MKKHQLIAMAISTLSAGIIISCTKPNDTEQNSMTEPEKTVSTTPEQSTETDTANQDLVNDPKANSSNVGATTDAIELSAKQTHDYLTHIANAQIIPAYQNATKQSNRLRQLAAIGCTKSAVIDADELKEARQQWLALAKAWASAEMINFGPATNSMSNLYINYYPDERGQVHQGVIDLINASTTLTPEQLSSESAVVQGIPGLEEVLYANESLNSKQCQYFVTASDALTRRLDEIQKTWQQDFAELLGIDDDNTKLGLNRWINSLLSLVETTKSTAIDKPLGLTGHKKGHVPAATAGHSRDIINAKVAVLNTALTDPKLVQILAENNQDTLGDALSTVLAEISTLLAQMPDDIAKASPEQQQALYDKLTTLTQVIKRQLMPVLGVQVGFNSTDGD